MRVKVANVAFSKNDYLVRRLRELFPQAEINTKGVRYQGKELIEYFKDADAAIVGLENIIPEVLDALPDLKCVAKYGVGLDNIDLAACENRGVYVGWTPGVNKEAVAELTLGFILALFRNICLTSGQLKQGHWNKNGGSQLKGKTIGIIGLGNIGKELVRLISPFQCRIIANDITDQSEFAAGNGVEIVSKEYLYNCSDVITIHTPFTTETDRMINGSVFAQLKRTAFLINTARGGIVDEVELKQALISGKIAGAALDVYSTEPPSDMELIGLSNLICTPHIGGNSYEAVVEMGLSAIDHLLHYKQVK